MRLSASIVLGLCFLCMRASARQNIDWVAVHEETAAAIRQMYNLQYDKSEHHASAAIRLAPRDPRGHFVRAMTSYYRYIFEGRSDQDFKRFISATVKVEQICDAILKNNNADSKAKFYMGGIIGYRGLAKFGKGDNIGALWDGKKAYNLIEESLEDDPNNADAQMGLGLFNYLISRAPSSIRPALSAAGLSGNKYQGLKQLENAAKNGIYAREEARRWLAEFYSWEDMPQRSAGHLKSLIKDYPNNIWLRLQYTSLLFNSLRQSDAALAIAKEISEQSDASTYKREVCIGRKLCAAIYSAKNKFPEAIDWYKKALNIADSSQSKDIYYRIGRIMEMQGDRKEGWNYYIKSGKPKSEFSIPMRTGEIAAAMVENYFRAGEYDKAVSEYSIHLQKSENDTDKSRIYYAVGRACTELEKYSEAEGLLQKTSDIIEGDFQWIPAYAKYRLGIVYAKQHKKVLAEQTFEKALSIIDKDNYDQLEELISKEKRRYKL